MHHVSATRKKSCAACVKSKRRCDLELPACRRCRTKKLTCKYPPISARKEDEAVRPDLPLEVSALDSPAEYQLPHDDTHMDPLFFPFLGDEECCESLQGDWNLLLPKDNTIPEPRIGTGPWSRASDPNFLNNDQVQYIIRSLRAFVPSMAYTGSTLFLHQNLWDHYQPEAYQDCVAISSLYLCTGSRNKGILTSTINAKIAGLISASGTWTLSEHLAAVQALIIYQIIRLYDTDLHQQAQAGEHNAVLELWAACLWKRFFNEPHALANDYDAWIFEESLRRTILMSIFTRCGWTCMTKGGLVDQVPVMARLPLTRDLNAWKRTLEVCALDSLPMSREQETLVAYGDFSHAWTQEQEVEQLDPFSKLLLAACRGADDPRLLA